MFRIAQDMLLTLNASDPVLLAQTHTKINRIVHAGTELIPISGSTIVLISMRDIQFRYVAQIIKEWELIPLHSQQEETVPENCPRKQTYTGQGQITQMKLLLYVCRKEI